MAHRPTHDIGQVEHTTVEMGLQFEQRLQQLTGAAADVADASSLRPIERGIEGQRVHTSAGGHRIVERGPPIGMA